MAYFYGMKHLRDLFPEHPDNPEIRNLCINSQDVKPGDLFICTKGATTDRHDFVLSAVENGAAAVVASRPVDVSVPVVYVNNTNEAMPHLAATLYEHPENKMNLTAVTGTNGKTTAATILSEMMGQEWFGYIGTNGVASSVFREPIRNTCPDADRMYLYLRRLADAGCTSTVLEATSEALLFGRLNAFSFDTVIFTNITQDHLNTHKTIENYVKAKLHLLDLLKKDATVILNADDKYFEREKTAAGEHRILSYGMAERADLRIESIECMRAKTILKVTVRGHLAGSAPSKYETEQSGFALRPEQTKNERVYTIVSPLVGDFNAWNLCAAICAMLDHGLRMEEVISRIAWIRPIAGRMEELFFGQPYRLVLDYAHTPDAFRHILPFLKMTKEGRLITLTGSAGGRDRGKRPEIGRLVTEYSDLVIFTADDPRMEDVNGIIDDLISESEKKNNIRIPDRKKAIAEALRMAKASGWEFACHTWGHLSVTGKSVESLSADQDRWQNTVANITGKTDTIIFAHGNDIGTWRDYDASTNDVYAYFERMGYNFYANVDATSEYWVQIRKDYVRQGRIDCDGLQMWRAKSGAAKTNVFENFFNVNDVFDSRRPTPVSATGKS